MRLINWLRDLFGWDSNKDDDGESALTGGSDPDWSQYSLYEIGYYMCRYYPDEWGDYSMGVVLNKAYGDAQEITPKMIADLDRLLEESVAESDELTKFEMHNAGEPYLEEDKVVQFRKEFFDCFPQQAIENVLARMYNESREDFQLERLVGEETIDCAVFEYHVEEEPQSAQIAMEGDPIEMQTMSFQTSTVEMQKVAGQFDLGESLIGDTIEEMVEVEAELLWDALDVTDESGEWGDDEDMIYSTLDAMREIHDVGGDPDTIIVDDRDTRWNGGVGGCSIHADQTGVMDVPFVVADSDIGFCVTAKPLSITKSRNIEEPHQYSMLWRGNYAITNKELISGPV